MTHRVQELLREALKLPPEERAAFPSVMYDPVPHVFPSFTDGVPRDDPSRAPLDLLRPCGFHRRGILVRLVVEAGKQRRGDIGSYCLTRSPE